MWQQESLNQLLIFSFHQTKFHKMKYLIQNLADRLKSAFSFCCTWNLNRCLIILDTDHEIFSRVVATIWYKLRIKIWYHKLSFFLYSSPHEKVENLSINFRFNQKRLVLVDGYCALCHRVTDGDSLLCAERFDPRSSNQF